MTLFQANSRKQGDVGMGLAIGYFASQGYTVCIPLTDSQDFDLVVEIDGKLKKVQVKTTRFKAPSGRFIVSLRTLGGNRSWTGKIKLFDGSAIDFLFIVTEAGTMYLIPGEDIVSVNAITLGPNVEKYRTGG